jgi:hypothetical protein
MFHGLTSALSLFLQRHEGLAPVGRPVRRRQHSVGTVRSERSKGAGSDLTRTDVRVQYVSGGHRAAQG